MSYLQHKITAGGTGVWSSRARLKAILGIWVLFALLVGGATMLNHGSTAAGGGVAVGNPHVTTVSVAAAKAKPILSADPSGKGLNVPTVDPTQASDPMVCNVGMSNDCTTKYTANPQDLLPAWRWSQVSDLMSSPGANPLASPAQNIFGALAGLFYAIAGWMWALLLALLDWALNMSLVNSAAVSINHGFQAIASTIIASPIVMILLFVAAVYIARLVLRAKVGKVLAIVLVMLIPLSLLWGLTAALAGPTDTATGVPRGSPAWIAVMGTSFVNTVGTSLATGFGGWSSVNNTNSIAVANTGANPSCSSYNAALYDQYYSYARLNKSDAFPGSNTAMANSGLVTVSILWQKSFQPMWIDSQFGSVDQGSQMYCHLLENNANITGDEGHSLILVAGQYQGQNFHDYSSAGFENIPGGNTSNKDLQIQMMAWAACTRTGYMSYKPDPNWNALTTYAISPSNPNSCKDWFTLNPNDDAAAPPGSSSTNALVSALNFGDTGNLQSNEQGAQQAAMQPGVTSDGISAAGNTVAAMWGHDTSQIILDSLMALITAIVYLYALGALAIGSVLAQVGLVLMLIILPVTLVLLAIPTKEGGRIPAGPKLMKMTLGFFISKMSLLLVMLILLESIQTLENLIGTTGGFLGSVMVAGIPLVCLFLVRKLLQAAGVGNLTSLSGALAMPMASAMGATGDKQMRGKMSAMTTAGAERLGLNKADALAKSAGRKALGSPVAAGKWGMGKTGDSRLGRSLTRKKEGLFGKKENGELTELGLKHRMRSLTSLMAMADGGGRTQAVAEKFLNSKMGKRMANKREYLDELNPDRSTKVAEQQRQERLDLKKATAGMKGDEFRDAMALFYEGRADVKLSYQTGVRDSHGELVRDAAGMAVLGWSLADHTARDPDGLRARSAGQTLKSVTQTSAAAAQKVEKATEVKLDTSDFNADQKAFYAKLLDSIESTNRSLTSDMEDLTHNLVPEKRTGEAVQKRQAIEDAAKTLTDAVNRKADFEEKILEERTKRASGGARTAAGGGGGGGGGSARVDEWGRKL